MNAYKFTQIIIALMGIWLIIENIQILLYSLHTLYSALSGDYRSDWYMSYAAIPVIHFCIGIMLGVILITVRKHIARLICVDIDETINLSSREIKNIAFMAIPAWIIIQALTNLAFFFDNAWNDIGQIIFGLILLSISYFYLLKKVDKELG